MNKYSLSQIVYLITDPDQLPRIITAYTVRQNGLTYELSCGAGVSWHFDFEISKDKTIQI